MTPELLVEFRNGAKAAKAEVYRLYIFRIAALVTSGLFLSGGNRVPGIKNDDDHADVVQEIFRRAFEDNARLGYRGEQDYWLYLCVIARNVVVDHYRSRGRLDLVPGRDSSDPADVLARVAAPEPEEPEHGYLEPRARAIVREYVAALRDPMRAVHDAIYVERQFQEQVAKQLRISRRKVQKLLDRMERDVRALLEQAGIRDSNVTPGPEGLFHG